MTISREKAEMKKNGGLIIGLIKQSWYWMIPSIVLGFSGAIFNGIGMTLVIPIVISFLGVDPPNIAEMPPILRSLFSLFDGVPDGYKVLAMTGTVFLTIALKGLCNYLTSVVSSGLSRRLSINLRKECFHLLLELDLGYFSRVRLGDIMNYINSEVSRASQSVSHCITIAISGITITVFLAILVSISWELTIVAIVILGFLSLSNQFFTRFAKRSGRELSKASAAYSIHLVEVLSGIRLIKSVANENAEFDKTISLIKDREDANFKSQLAFAAVAPSNEVLNVIAIILLVITGRVLFADDLAVFSSVILTYLFLLTRMLPFIGKLYGARNQIANASASVKNVEDYLYRGDKPIMQSGSYLFEGLKKEIRFNSMWFQYSQSKDWNLQDIDIVLPKGKTLALVGSSGAGKSTIADLLARFYDPSKGCIEIDGICLKDLSIEEYRRNIGIVSQDTFLFNASVKENIKYGYPHITDEAVFQAAKLANAIDFIQNLPQGFDTKIGDRGVMLSGGQRQRLSIARALLQNPEILILDEATSALDTVSERLVQEALENLSHNRTTLVIAHRLSTIQKADQIVVLEKGQVVEVGDHNTLLKQGGHYAELHAIQFADHPNYDENKGQVSEFTRDSLNEASYNIRSQLNGILGILEISNSTFELSPKESQELTSSVYQSSLNILKYLEMLENKILLSQ
ncbi:MAG: ABC transporter ATP-binding protein [Cyanobacteria bacterium P01_A01_bin.37]